MTLPISRIVQVTPSTLGVAGGVNFINGLLLTKNPATTAGKLSLYTSLQEIEEDFLPASIEYQMAQVYFSSYTGAQGTPAKLYFYGAATPEGMADAPSFDANVCMNSILKVTQDFAGFATCWEPSLAEKQALAEWTSAQDFRFWYVAWDSDEEALKLSGSSSFGAWLQTQKIDGVTAVYKDPLAASLCLSWMASLDFSASDGRTTLSMRASGLVTPSVTNEEDANALEANGYNYYASFANGLGQWSFLRNGSISGSFLWADSFINQIWLNASLQSNLLNLLLSRGNIPYNEMGDGLISSSVQDTISQALSFGAIRAGVSLTDEQKQQINTAAGVNTAANAVQVNGYYFQPNASNTPASDRVARKSPPCKFWYTDGQSVQNIHLSSVEVQ